MQEAGARARQARPPARQQRTRARTGLPGASNRKKQYMKRDTIRYEEEEEEEGSKGRNGL